MSILTTAVFNKRSFFSDNDAGYISSLMATGDMCSLDDKAEYTFLKMWRSVNDDTSDFQKQILIEILEKIIVEHDAPDLYRCHKGADIDIILQLDDNNLEGLDIVARNSDDMSAITSPPVAGTDDLTQVIVLNNISLAPATFYKIYILAESSDTSGDAKSLLGTIYLFVEESIDSNER
jgi:hypothetical protein